jgi:hypothetical protein
LWSEIERDQTCDVDAVAGVPELFDEDAMKRGDATAGRSSRLGRDRPRAARTGCIDDFITCGSVSYGHCTPRSLFIESPGGPVDAVQVSGVS